VTRSAESAKAGLTRTPDLPAATGNPSSIVERAEQMGKCTRMAVARGNGRSMPERGEPGRNREEAEQA